MTSAPVLRPPVSYFGGKQRLAHAIVGQFPAHRHYVEPFAGSLSVLLAKPVSKLETVNDLDGDLMTFWRVLRDRPTELARACALTPHAREELRLAQDRADNAMGDLERARRVWVALTQGRSAQTTRTGWRHYVSPSGTSLGMPGYLDAYVDRMAAAATRLHHVSLECRDALELIDSYGRDPEVLLYLDPPYLADVRGGRNATSSYRYEMRTNAQHAALLDLVVGVRASVALSGYAHPLYEAALTGWRRVEFAAFTGNGSSTPRGRGARVEVLWTNCDPHPTLISEASCQTR